MCGASYDLPQKKPRKRRASMVSMQEQPSTVEFYQSQRTITTIQWNRQNGQW